MTRSLKLNPPRFWLLLRRLLMIGGGLSILTALVSWGGTARPGPLFVAGVALLSGLLLCFALLTAWLYSGPASAAQPLTRERAELRQTIALFALISTFGFIIGTAWDEAWHRRFGGFGNDFLWPPHLVLYGSIALFAAFAGLGLWQVLRGQGALRARFRSESQVGLLALVATLMIASLPSDELWHRIYGKDLTAWSLPHVLIAIGVTLIALVGAGLALVRQPHAAEWQDLRQVRPAHLLALLLTATGTIMLLQLGTTEWEGIQQIRPGAAVFQEAFWQRPQWLYPVVVTTIALFVFNFAQHLLRLAGGATLVALVALGFRLVVLSAGPLGRDGATFGATAQLMLLAPALVLDGWYWLQQRRADRLSVLVGGNLLATLALLAVGLPLIARLMLYPPINSYTVPRMIGMSVLLGLGSGWAGACFGRWLSAMERVTTALPVRRRALLLIVGGSGLAALLLLAVVLTAQTPVTAG